MLGDCIAEALANFGVTESEVSRWLGRPCGCVERKAKLNQLDLWARRVLSGKVTRAREFLTVLMSES